MKTSIITISREFGSGGRTIGKQLAQRLGVPYYDKELVRRVAGRTGFDEGYIEQAGEYAPVKSWLSYALSPLGIQGAMDGMSADDFLWSVQRKIILDLAEQGPCIIVGRCADFILKDRTDCLNVFIYADTAFRAARIVRLYGNTEKSPEKRLEEKDRRRRLYCRRYTDREWGMAEHYHLALNSGAFGLEVCTDAILKLVEKSL